MRLLAVGDSFTYGEELADRNFAWPALLARSNNWSVDNFGKGGASNDRSIRVVFDEIENNYDLMKGLEKNDPERLD